jgi:hypothetical protein
VTVYQVQRDGRTLATFPTYPQALHYLHDIQGMSADWAMRYEGYKITEHDNESEVQA